MAFPPETLPGRACACFCGTSGLVGIISIIVTLASIKTLGPEDQFVIHDLDGKYVVNGPTRQVFNPFRTKELRKALRIGNLEYVRIKDSLTGDVRVVPGHARVFLGAYEEHEPIQQKISLTRDQYIRLLDRLSGNERVLQGPRSVVPGPWEESNKGVQQAAFVNRDLAVIVLNKEDGRQRLVEATGPFFPDKYEVVTELRTRIRVLQHETMVVRNAFGKYIIHSGKGVNGSASGHSFFLQPYEEIVVMRWSSFSEPPEGGLQQVSSINVDRIDMRARKTFYQYDVRTNDNVALRIEGAIFWKVLNVTTMLKVTSDPAGDVWYKARSTLTSAVSKVDLETFMASFTTLLTAAFDQADSTFYSARGLEVHSMEVTKYDCTDAETAITLQEIIEETTNRINRLQAQRSDNDVRAAKLAADIILEKERLRLLETQSENEKLAASNEGEAEGMAMSKSAQTFISELNASVPELNQRVELFKMHKQLENQNERTKHLAQGHSTLFMTAEDLNLNMGSVNEL